MRSEHEHAGANRLRCAGAPPGDSISPIGPAIAPVNDEELHAGRVWQLGRVRRLASSHTGPSSGIEDLRPDDQVPTKEDDRHSAGVGIAAMGGTPAGWGCATCGRAWGVGGCTPFPFIAGDPYAGMT